MIFCELDGGLGNVLFTMAAMLSFAKDNNAEVSFSNFSRTIDRLNNEPWRPKDKHCKEYSYILNGIITDKIEGFNGIKNHIGWNVYDFKFQDNSLDGGYFHDEMYFKHNRDYILTKIKPNSFVSNFINNKYESLVKAENTVSVHVRRGSYLSAQHVLIVQNKEYYLNALSHFDENIVKVVFSDDLPWCKEVFSPLKNVVFVENEKDYIELILMSKMKNHIISNSTFSWWGAWLNQNPNKKVIAPKNWFNPNYLKENNVVPKNWIQL